MTRIIALVVALAARTQAFVQPQPLRKASSSLQATTFLLPARARPSRFPRSRELKTITQDPQPPRTTSSSLHATPFLLPARARPSRFPRSRDKTVARELTTSSSLDATDFLVPARARPSRFPRSRELTTISRDPTLATSVSTAGAALVAWHSVVGAAYWRGSFVLDLPFLVFSLFLFLQTYRTRFVFDASAFEVTKRNLDGAPLATDNFVVGGRSRWDYGAIGGYKFLPARAAPALLYFTETATTGAEPQMHLCPVLGAAGELEREFARHGVPRL